MLYASASWLVQDHAKQKYANCALRSAHLAHKNALNTLGVSAKNAATLAVSALKSAANIAAHNLRCTIHTHEYIDPEAPSGSFALCTHLTHETGFQRTDGSTTEG